MSELQYLEDLIETLTPDDVRQLILAEDELSQCYNFYRIYPTTSTHTYTPYFELPRYYNMLFDAWETKYHDDRSQAVARLVLLCRQKIHLQVPVNAGSMVRVLLIKRLSPFFFPQTIQFRLSLILVSWRIIVEGPLFCKAC